MSSPFDTLLKEALAEDIGPGDVTTAATVPPGARCAVRLLAKETGVLSGITVFRRVFELTSAAPEHWSGMEDGARFEEGDCIASFIGTTQGVLTGERVALNFLQRLSGVATLTARFVDAVEGTGARICDTRKTTPLLRALEKAAVRHGGGTNHRCGLYDGILIKENHVAAAGGIENAVMAARTNAPHLLRIEVEVRNLNELDEALESQTSALLLDNMPVDAIREAVNRAKPKGILLEASGGVMHDNVRAIAETGVDLISVGALTHSAPAVDMSLLIAPHA